MMNDLMALLMRAKPGEAVEYWRGFIAYDRCMDNGRRERSHIDPQSEAHRIADLALSLEAQGMVELVQRRHADMDYSYLAVKCGKPRKTAKTSILADIRRAYGKPQGVSWAR